MWESLLAITIIFGLVIFLVATYTRRLVDASITEQFRAAESITNGRVPEKWIVDIKRQLSRTAWLPGSKPGTSGAKLALQKLDHLIRFFERSNFYENAQAREELLNCLNTTRERWLKMTWQEILAENIAK